MIQHDLYKVDSDGNGNNSLVATNIKSGYIMQTFTTGKDEYFIRSYNIRNDETKTDDVKNSNEDVGWIQPTFRARVKTANNVEPTSFTGAGETHTNEGNGYWLIENIVDIFEQQDQTKTWGQNNAFGSEIIECEILDAPELLKPTYLFRNCINMTTANVDELYRATDATALFSSNHVMKTADISKLVNLTNLNRLFETCVALESIKMPKITHPLTRMLFTFKGCVNLKCIDGVNTTNITGVKDRVFLNCHSLVAPNLAEQALIVSSNGLDYTNTKPCPQKNLFQMTVTSSRFPGFRWYNAPQGPNASHVLHVDYMNNGTYNVWSNDPIQTIGFDANKEYITKVVVIKGDTVTGNFHMEHCAALTDVDISKLVNLTSGGNMFNSTKLIHVDISSLSKLTNTVGMLNNCHSLLTVVGVEAATRNSTNNRAMFAGSEKLRCIDGIDTRKGIWDGTTNQNIAIFMGCNALVQPNAGSCAALERIPGTSWHNHYPCGTYTPPKNFEMKVTSRMQPEVMDVSGGTIITKNNNDGTWLLWSNNNITAFKMGNNKEHITKIEMLEANTVTTVEESFVDCILMTTFDGHKLINVSNANSGWKRCVKLTNFDTSWMTRVSTVNHAWDGCTGFTSFDTKGLTSVWNVGYAWLNCSNIIDFDASGLINVQWAEYAWQNCKSMLSFDATKLTKVTRLIYTWQGCTSLTSFDTSGMTVANNITSAWQDCTGLTSFDASGLISAQTPKHAWQGCTGLTSFDTSGLTSIITAWGTWQDCTGLTSFDASGLTSLTNIALAWMGCTSLTHFDASSLRGLISAQSSWEHCTSLVSFNNCDWLHATNTYRSWNGCTNLTCIDKINTRRSTDKDYLFGGCTSLVRPNAAEQADLQDANGAVYVNARPCPPLTRFKMHVTAPTKPTYSATGGTLTTIDNNDGTWTLSSSDVITALRASNKVDVEVVVELALDLTNIENAWLSCKNLTTFDPAGLTSAVGAKNAWSTCPKLASFDASGLTSVTNVTTTWYNCIGLTSFDASGLTSVTQAYRAWDGCTNLVCFSELDSTGFTDAWGRTEMFLGCTSLVRPNAAEQTDLHDSNGAVYVNANACP